MYAGISSRLGWQQKSFGSSTSYFYYPCVSEAQTFFQVEYLYDQNFEELREQCLREKKLFEDPEFPPDEDLLRTRSKRVSRRLDPGKPPALGSILQAFRDLIKARCIH